MANIFDYLEWRGDLTFEQSPFNPVDNLILSRLSYLPLEGIVPGTDSNDSISISETAQKFAGLDLTGGTEQFSLYFFKEDPRLLSVLRDSKRFCNLRLSHFVNIVDICEEKQFAALTISGKKFPPYISFRGTDWTIVGWKEDFNMSFLSEIPSQIEAVSYLEKVAKVYRKKLRVGGHSKGGNLAVYASAFCHKNIQRRILEVYNNDGPGFRNEIIEKPSFQNIANKIHTFVPQSSIVGMLFEHEEKYTVVESIQKGLLQHDLFSWNVVCDDVSRIDEVDNSSRFIDKTMKEWLCGLSPEQRKELVNHVYTIFTSTKALTLQELTSQWQKSAIAMIKTISNLDENTKKNLSTMFSILVKAAKNNINYILPDQLVQMQKHSLFHQTKPKAENNSAN
ncbi:MAG: DUF2974 domain-containing protein [Treponema sp.]|nr:DUF2974 domain-containing protein [Treponema sp.]